MDFSLPLSMNRRSFGRLQVEFMHGVLETRWKSGDAQLMDHMDLIDSRFLSISL